MIENTTAREKTPQARPREAIESDLSALQGRFQAIDQELNSIADRIEALSEDQQLLINQLVARLEREDVLDDELKALFAEPAIPVAVEAKTIMHKYKNLVEAQAKLEQELTPRLKQDFERMLKDISARINYNAVFRERDGGKGPADLLDNIASQLYEVRRFQYNLLVPGDEIKDFAFYDYRCRALELFSKEWEERGLMLDSPKNDFDYNRNFGEEIHVARIKLASILGGVLEQQKKYDRLSKIYQHGLPSCWPFDFRLYRLHLILELKNEYRLQDYKDFEQVGYDPAFIEAAEEYIAEIIEGHRKIGHLPPTPDMLKEERRRIDAIEDLKQVSDVRIEGFDAPEGMIAVTTPQEVLEEIRKLMPPDFIRGLSALSHKNWSDKPLKDDPNAEIIGAFFPVFDGDGILTAAEIEIYGELFVSKNASDIDKALVKFEFMDMVWHELGHNAHHMMRYDELEAWEETVISEDPTPVTYYVQHAREDNQSSGKREDFSESFRLFVTNPALLYTLSPLRCQFMLEYFVRRLRTNQREALQARITAQSLAAYTAWERNGYTKDDIRRIYLSIPQEKSSI